MQRKIAYSKIALSKRKTIKKDIKEKYGKERADKFSKHISKNIAELKKFPELGVSLREKYDLDCDYYILFIEHNYFIYRIFEDMILILEYIDRGKLSNLLQYFVFVDELENVLHCHVDVVTTGINAK